MIPPLQHLRAFLDGLVPGGFNASLAALLWVALWGLRKFKPLFFAKLPPALQAWPALAVGAVIAALSASTGANVGEAVLNALGMSLTGLLSGVLSVGAHRVLKESPLPYGAHDIPPKPPTGPLVAIVVGLLLTGCMGAKSAITEACTVIDSGNPTIGVLCVTAEEIASLFSHVKAARAYRATHMSASPSATVDICEGSPQ